MQFLMAHNLVLDDGRTIKQHNLEQPHNIPIGALVELKFEETCGGGACMKVHARLWVVEHYRDCDGTPLYALGKTRGSVRDRDMFCGFVEHRLTLVEITAEVIDVGLTWDEEPTDLTDERL